MIDDDDLDLTEPSQLLLSPRDMITWNMETINNWVAYIFEQRYMDYKYHLQHVAHQSLVHYAKQVIIIIIIIIM